MPNHIEATITSKNIANAFSHMCEQIGIPYRVMVEASIILACASLPDASGKSISFLKKEIAKAEVKFGSAGPEEKPPVDASLQRMRYVGVLSLLSRLSSRIHNQEDIDAIERALADGCEDGRLKYSPAAGGGFVLDINQEPEDARG